MKKYIEGLEGYKALVIDIRGNTGGYNYYWENIVSMLIQEDVNKSGYTLLRDNEYIDTYVHYCNDYYGVDRKPISELPEEVMANCPLEVSTDFKDFVAPNMPIVAKPVSNFNGNIYLLVDDKVYSSAENLAIFAKDSDFATIVGRTTKGGGCMDFTPCLFKLKNSGLIGRMSTGMYITKDGICNEEFKTTPDHVIIFPDRNEDFQQDNCIKKVLELEGMPSN